jgi:hypothetical protein
MQRGLGALRDDARFGPWVYQVARSAIVDHQRRAAKHVIPDLDDAADVAVEEEDDDRAIERDLASYITPFVAMLSSPYREALTLTELEGVTLKDCCHIALDVRGRVVSCEPRTDGKVPDTCCTSARTGKCTFGASGPIRRCKTEGHPRAVRSGSLATAGAGRSAARPRRGPARGASRELARTEPR